MPINPSQFNQFDAAMSTMWGQTFGTLEHCLYENAWRLVQMFEAPEQKGFDDDVCLTEREINQIRFSLDGLDAVTVQGQKYVSKHNVICIVGTYVQWETHDQEIGYIKCMMTRKKDIERAAARHKAPPLFEKMPFHKRLFSLLSWLFGG